MSEKAEIIEYSQINSTHKSLPQPNNTIISKQFLIRETLKISDFKPNIKELMSTTGKPQIKKYKVVNGIANKNLFIKGAIDQQILYKPSHSSENIILSRFSIPFYQLISLPVICTDKSIQPQLPPKVILQYLETEKISEREIEICAVVEFWL